MSTKEKLIERFIKQPKDFTFDEVVRLFGYFGFKLNNKGKTSGSRVLFQNGIYEYDLHKPHPDNIIKETALKRIKQYLTENNFIKK